MKNTCPFFGKCGGCKFDFAAADYKQKKLQALGNIKTTHDAVWIQPGVRRRADFAFGGGKFGMYESGTKNIIQISKCQNLGHEINQILPQVARLPWVGAGACLITRCDNGIDIAISSSVPYITPEFRRAANQVSAIRITWNNTIIKQTDEPVVNFDGHAVKYPSGAFLQPSEPGADTLRTLVMQYADGFKNIADLFCGLGNFTFALGADGFDIVGTGMKRDLFRRPLTQGMLKKYDCVVMDPPRAGAREQCHELIHSDVQRIIYVSCNPQTFIRDRDILTHGGYQMTALTPVDQFVGSTHWELVGVFDRK